MKSSVKRSLGFLILLSAISLCAGKLAFVIELYRHGARGPYYPNTWNSNQQTYQMQQLIPAGMRQHFILGQQIRKEYITNQNFLSPSYNWTEIYIRSTDVNRTLMSAQSHLYGLYPPGTGPYLPGNLSDIYQLPPYTGTQPLDIGLNALPNAYQVFPINTVNYTQDPLLNPWAVCPRFNDLLVQTYVEHASTLQYINAQLSQTNTLLGQMLNRTVNISIYEPIFDVFISDMYQGLPLPPNLTQAVWNNVTLFDTFSWFFNYSSIEERQLLVTPLFNYWIENLDIVASGKINYPSKWIMLSAHDSNLAQVITSLNFSSWQCQFDLWFKGSTDALNCVFRPYYAASILLELYQDDTNPKDYYVKIKYDGDYMNLCETQSTTCAYSEFSKRLKNWVVQDFDSQCKSKLKLGDQNLLAQALEFTESNSTYSFVFDAVVVESIILLILIAALILKKYLKSNRDLYSKVANVNHCTEQTSNQNVIMI